jgi:hypothetical protein
MNIVAKRSCYIREWNGIRSENAVESKLQEDRSNDPLHELL